MLLFNPSLLEVVNTVFWHILLMSVSWDFAESVRLSPSICLIDGRTGPA